MAKYEDYGFCPYTDVNDALHTNIQQHLNLFGLWNMIRTQSVCKGFQTDYQMNTRWIVDALSDDPIAEPLMKAIIRANPRPNMVEFLEPRLENNLGFQDTLQIATLLQETGNKLVVGTGSKYIAIVGCGTNSTVKVYLFMIDNLEDLK